MRENGNRPGQGVISRFTGIDKGNPVEQVRHLFKSGQWLNTYELPFFQPTYLQANTYSYWQTGNLQSQTKDGLLTEFTKGTMKIDFPTQPAFTFTDVNNSGYDGGRIVSIVLFN
jgi:hypothetical protein